MTKENESKSEYERSESETKILKTNIRIYYVFCAAGSLIVLVYTGLLAAVLATSPKYLLSDERHLQPEDYRWREINNFLKNALLHITNSFFLVFFIAYLFTLSILRHRLKTYFPVYYN